MDLLVVSDLHLKPDTTERNQLFLRFLESAHGMGQQVVIAGDLFDLWLGWGKFTFDYQRPIIERMRELATAGLILNYVEGNRDFRIREYQGSIFRSVWSHRMALTWGSRRVCIVHGDLINQEDKQYRFWRAISKNKCSFLLLSFMPASFLLKFSTGVEQKLKRTNLRYRRYFPEQQCREFFQEEFKRGFEIVVAGHFHHEREMSVQQNGQTVLFYSLPGWEGGFRYLVIPEDKNKPYFQELGRLDNGNSSTA